MELINEILIEHSAIQATIVLAIIITIGTALGKVKIFGLSLGVTFVFFVGILAGHLGCNIDPDMLTFAQRFGLVLFVYEVGLEVGPGFFRSFLGSGIRLNLISIVNIVLGTMLAFGLAYALSVPLADMSGILNGAVTNTPALAAAQETLSQLGIDATGAALGCAVTYPLGVVGVILAMAILNKTSMVKNAPKQPEGEDTKQPYVATFMVKNPACDGMKLRDLAHLTKAKFVISRLWKDDAPADAPTGDTELQLNDHLMIITEKKYLSQLTLLFGLQDKSENWNRDDVNWDELDGNLLSRNIVITRSTINGRKLGSLRLHNRYRVNVSRVNRMGLKLLATPNLTLQYGDRITVVGTAEALDKVEMEMGGKVGSLKEPNLASIFVGITLGLMLGCLPIMLPGMALPVRLGLAGGPIIAGILMGAYGARLRLRTYTTRSANLMLRGIGLSLYLACLGLASGQQFIETVMRPEGLLWIVLGFIITFVPIIIIAIWCLKVVKMDVGSTYGLLCGSMANPMALSYASECIEGDSPAVSYATVYPLGMFIRVVIIQVLLLMLL
ncbi:MAG: putative transporter [Bacteroidales bacterium]|nr:putative transporter [Bacteroidales bacterium]